MTLLRIDHMGYVRRDLMDVLDSKTASEGIIFNHPADRDLYHNTIYNLNWFLRYIKC